MGTFLHQEIFWLKDEPMMNTGEHIGNTIKERTFHSNFCIHMNDFKQLKSLLSSSILFITSGCLYLVRSWADQIETTNEHWVQCQHIELNPDWSCLVVSTNEKASSSLPSSSSIPVATWRKGERNQLKKFSNYKFINDKSATFIPSCCHPLGPLGAKSGCFGKLITSPFQWRQSCTSTWTGSGW